MAEFESTVTDTTVFGDRRVKFGTFFSSGGIGGGIETGLGSIEFFQASNLFQAATIGAAGGYVSGVSVLISGTQTNTGTPVIFPISGGSIDILCPLNASGQWMAWGKR